MADDNFDRCLAFVLSAEGGYVDNPLDPGGATNLGITLRVLSEWRHSAVTKQDVRGLGREEAAGIYRANYWNVMRGEGLPAGIDLMVFDGAVNLGPGRSAKMLQAVVGVTEDGSIGPKTIDATRTFQPVPVIESLAARRLDFYHSLSTFADFGAGWIRRVDNAKGLALHMAQPPVGQLTL